MIPISVIQKINKLKSAILYSFFCLSHSLTTRFILTIFTNFSYINLLIIEKASHENDCHTKKYLKHLLFKTLNYLHCIKKIPNQKLKFLSLKNNGL